MNRRSWSLPAPARTGKTIMLTSNRKTTRMCAALYASLNPAELKRQIEKKLEKIYEMYQKEKKRPLTVDPYKKQIPSTVTFLMIQQ
ncbi:MAG: hypothetical protein GTN43_01100 [Candidatus Aenigmarchaeota archaeon]|nr:hypothetical protein [Candidatus Aenigmarchaeota archaeon]